jgi:hypothetical protein
VRPILICAPMLAGLLGPAWGENVTLADLTGSVVEASASYENSGLWEGRHVLTQSRTDWKIIIQPGGAVRGEWSMTIHGARGTRRTAPVSFSFVLGQPKKTTNLGGGHSVWLFENGVLTRLQTFKVGGFQLKIAFHRSGEHLTCSVSAPQMREIGAGNTQRESAFGGRFEIISSKQVASTCQIKNR